MLTRRTHVAPLLIAAFAAACVDRPLEPAAEALDVVPGPAYAKAASVAAAPLTADHAQAYIAEKNAELAESGIAIARAELMLAPGANPKSQSTVFAADRQLRLDTRWVPDDARRAAQGNDLTYATFGPLAVSQTAGPVAEVIEATFDTWAAGTCVRPELVRRELDPGVFPGALFGLIGFVNDPFAADISTVGFLPGLFFDVFLGPGASEFVLGVTFTFVFIDADRNPTDIDGDRRADTALKEIWYNDEFTWSLTGDPGTIDVESVALHENGHALELGHFGRIAFNPVGRLLVSPRAVMNAAFVGPLRTLRTTDTGAICGNFANWPH